MVDRHWNLVKNRPEFFQLDAKKEAIRSIPFKPIQDWQFLTITSFTQYAFRSITICEWQYSTTGSHTHSFHSKSTSKWSRFLVDRKNHELFRETSRPSSWNSDTGITKMYQSHWTTIQSHSWKCVINRSIFNSNTTSNPRQIQVQFFSKLKIDVKIESKSSIGRVRNYLMKFSP